MEWRESPSFPCYEVSEFGDVRRCRKGIFPNEAAITRLVGAMHAHYMLDLAGGPQAGHRAERFNFLRYGRVL